MARKTPVRKALDQLTKRVQEEMRDTREIWNCIFPQDPDTEWCCFLIGTLDPGELEPKLTGSQSRWDPTMLCTYLVMTALEIRSARQLAQTLADNPKLRELCGMGDHPPSTTRISQSLQHLGQNTQAIQEQLARNLDIDFSNKIPENQRDALRAAEACTLILEFLIEGPEQASPPLKIKLTSSAQRALGSLQAPPTRGDGEREAAIRLGLEVMARRRTDIRKGRPATTLMRQIMNEIILVLFPREEEKRPGPAGATPEDITI